MKSVQHLITAYISILKIQDNYIRLQLQSTYCALRNEISRVTGKSEEEIQTTCEELALRERSLTRDY